jgi:uncharacterized protein YbjT (DUF2867 family)
MLRLKKQSSQLTFLTGTPLLPFTTSSQDVTEQTRSGHTRATAEAAKRTLLVSFPQTGEKQPGFALLATRAPRTVREFVPSNTMQILVTGVSGYAGAALAARLRRDGHTVRGFARSSERVTAAGVELDDLVLGDMTTGAGLERALDGIDVGYYLVHSMEGAAAGAFAEAERRSAAAFAEAAAGAGLRRVVYLGGLVPADAPLSRHLGSRLAVEDALLDAVPEGIALRASIVVGARSRSFRFLVRLIERLPVMALPAWRENRTAPIDGRDMLDYLTRAATAPSRLSGRSWDIGGPDVMTYAAMIARISDALMVRRPSLGLGVSLTPIASVVAAAIAGEDPALIEPLMESLEHDLLPRDGDAAAAFGVHLHSFDAAVERALREWEWTEELAAR